PGHRVDVRGATQRVDAVAVGLPGQQVLEGGLGRGGGVLAGQRPQQGDADGAGVEVGGMRPGDPVAGRVLAGERVVGDARCGRVRVAALVDVAGLVDQEVVADVTPALD